MTQAQVIATAEAEPLPESELIAPSSVIPEHELRRLVYNELVNMLYRQLPFSMTGTLMVAVIMTAALWPQVPSHWLVIWLALMGTNQGSRLFLYRQFVRSRLQHLPIRWRARLWATGAVISGVLWGATAIFFYTPDSAVHQTMMVVLVLGSTTAGVPLIASHMPSLLCFLIPALTPYIARHLLAGDIAHFALGLILLAVTLALLAFGRNYHRLIVTSLRDRYENEALARQFARQNLDLEQARVIAEQANRSKTQFFAAASHDLRQPLHAMGLFAAALQEKVRDPEVSSIVASINTSVVALETLFNELLDISKIDSGVIRPALAPLRIDPVFERLRAEFAAEAAAKGLQLSVAPAHHVVSSDALLLERILRNLVSNAIRYTPAGEVSVTAMPANGQLRIEVRDTGIGIRDEHRQRVFEEFFQLGNPARTSRKGLGLGLSIVRRLCALLGYTIRVDSEFGKGSAFSFEVPLAATDALPEATTASAPAAPGSLAGRLVVVIDDESAVVDGMKALLSGWGASVIGSDSGAGIVSAVHEAGRIPDLLIVDHRLGNGETGIEVARRLRHELEPEMPAILITGSITPELAAEAAEAGLAFMLKPVGVAALRERISTMLGLVIADSGWVG